MSLLCRLKNLVHKGILKEEDLDRIVIIPKEQEPCEDCISRQGAIDALGYNISITSDGGLDEYRTVLKKMLRKIYDVQKAQIEALPSIQPTTKENLVVEDCISRAELLKAVDTWDRFGCDADSKLVPYKDCYVPYIHYDDVVKAIKGMPSVQPKTEWIPVSERLPEDLEPVNITWINHNPESYYADIKDKPFTATGHYCNGRWWWYSVTCQDYLNEYGRCDVDAMDNDIEVIAWMPLPEPYTAEKE